MFLHRNRRNLAIFLALALLVGGAATAAAAIPSDNAIQTAVSNRLAAHGFASTVQAAVADGTVTLTGNVDKLAAKSRAERLARQADGVAEVVNEIAVSDRRSDQAVADAISRALDGYFYYGVFDWVEASVQGGVVTLEGSVYTPWHRDAIVRRLEDVPGVVAIEDRLALQPVGDDNLRAQAFRAIYGHPMFDQWVALGRAPIHIIAHDGKLTLEGAVRSPVEKRLAGTVARLDTFAFGVTNHLRVDSAS